MLFSRRITRMEDKPQETDFISVARIPGSLRARFLMCWDVRMSYSLTSLVSLTLKQLEACLTIPELILLRRNEPPRVYQYRHSERTKAAIAEQRKAHCWKYCALGWHDRCRAERPLLAVWTLLTIRSTH